MASESRKQLVEATVDHLQQAGLTGLTLRSIASGVGTSHRMLIYHFGSLDGLITAVVIEVEERQRAHLAELQDLADLSLSQIAFAVWKSVSAPALAPLERLFFGLYARLLDEEDNHLVKTLVSSWLDPTTALLTSRGVPKAKARKLARLGLGVSRGLLLDLLATGEKRAVDAAMREYITQIYGTDQQDLNRPV